MVFGFNLFWSVIVIATLEGAAIFTEALQSISICKEVLPLCFTFVTKVFIVFYLHDWVYSVKKTPVGGGAIITKLTMSHYFTCFKKDNLSKVLLCKLLMSYFLFLFSFYSEINSFILSFSYSFCTDLLNLFTQINLIAYNIKTSVDA